MSVEKTEPKPPLNDSCSFEEEVSTDCSLDGYSTEGKSEGDDFSSPDTSCYQDPVCQELTSLIKDLIETTAESQPDQPSPSNHANVAPGLSTSVMPDLAPPPGLNTATMPDLTPPPGLNTATMPDLAPPPGLSTVVMPDLAPKNATENGKSANKKQQRAKDMVTSSSKSKCVTPEEAQAYHQKLHNEMAKYQIACVQQMAKYQMAYAQQYQMAYAQQCQQYQMAMQAFQMQQYSKQAQMAAGGSK
jgi:hypothetical protein